jgi:hypothetical protein
MSRPRAAETLTVEMNWALTATAMSAVIATRAAFQAAAHAADLTMEPR